MLARLSTRNLLCALALLAATEVTKGQSLLTGTVRSTSGEALVSATVSLRDTRFAHPRFGDVTGSDGSFVIERIPSGQYELVVRHVGFAPEVRRLEVRSDDVSLDIVLSSEPVLHEEVVVGDHRARRQLTPITFSNLTADELAEHPAMKDLPLVLSSRPSVTYHSENGNGIGYSTLRMRGFDQRRIAVSINGVPQNDPEDFNVFWINFFDIDGSIEDVQVQRGAGGSYYGSTGIGGAINIVARPYKPYPYAEFEASYGSYDTKRLSIEANSGLLDHRYVVFGRFSRLLSDGYRDWSWTEFWRFFGGITRYGERSTLTIQAFGGPQQDGLAFSGIPREANDTTLETESGDRIDRRYNASAISRDTENFHQPHVELQHDLQASETVRIRQTLFWVKGEGYFDFGADFRSADYLRLPEGFVPDEVRGLPLFLSSSAHVLFRAYLDQWQIGWMPRLSIDSRLGETTIAGEARLHRSLRWGRIQDGTGLPAEVVGSGPDRRVYQFKGEKTILSVNIVHEFWPAAQLAMQVEALLTFRQYRVYEEEFFGNRFRKPYVFLNPRVGFTLFPKSDWSAYVSLGYTSREPRLKSLYDGEEAGAGFEPRFERDDQGRLDMDRPLVDAEHLIDLELGTTRRGPAYAVTLSGFWMEFVDEIVPSGGLDQFGVPRTGNADRTRHVGVETEIELSPANWLDIYANVTLSRNRYLRFEEYVTQPDFSVLRLDRRNNGIPGFPSASAFLKVGLKKKGFRGTLFGKYAGRQFIDNSNARTVDGSSDKSLTVAPYLVVDASLQYEFNPASMLRGLTVGLDVNNVANSRVLLYGNVGPLGPQFFPTATRHALVTIRYVIR